jgi:hypothetical protein
MRQHSAKRTLNCSSAEACCGRGGEHLHLNNVCLCTAGTEAVGVADDGTSQPALPRSLDQLNALLAAAAALPSPPPMIVANPDLVTVDGDGLVTM